VFVALRIKHAMQRRHIVICGLPRSITFFHIISSTARFSKKKNVIEYKSAFWFSLKILSQIDVCGCVHHSIIHIENPTRCHSVSKFYFIFIWRSTCFGRHTAHHREPKTALAASGFACVEGCWKCSWWTLSGRVDRVYSAWQRPPTTRPATFHACKTRGCQCSFRLPMMGGVSPETCWASYKNEIKFWYTVASCWIFYMNFVWNIFLPKKNWAIYNQLILLSDFNGSWILTTDVR